MGLFWAYSGGDKDKPLTRADLEGSWEILIKAREGNVLSEGLGSKLDAIVAAAFMFPEAIRHAPAEDIKTLASIAGIALGEAQVRKAEAESKSTKGKETGGEN